MNYVKKIATMVSSSPGVYYCQIAHDHWCNLLNGCGECNCNPDITLKSMNSIEEYFEEVEKRERNRGSLE
jgi:hypothetical protein